MSLDFPPFELLRWIMQNYKEVKYDLASSNMPISVPDLSGQLKGVDLCLGSPTGSEELKKAISEVASAHPDDILVTNGASEANFLVCASLLSREEEALVERPYYEPLASIPRGLGASVKFIDRKPADFPLDLDVLHESITPATKLLILTNLHNPSGAQIPEEVLENLSQIAREKGFYVLCDEIFNDFAYAPSKHAFSFGERMISTVGMSKFYGTGGLRIGWILAEKGVLERCRRVKEHTAVTCSSLSEKMAVLVLQETERIKAKNREILNHNSQTVLDWARTEGIDMMTPAGANICFPSLPVTNTLNFCKHLLSKDTLVSPGEFFGLAGHVRIGFGCESSILQEGLNRVSEALHELAG